ncbi:hypothetical protein HELRODRAFT_187315 [Helobdella robusta]|uniref:CBS domain-containing protein n=1 Tax=Helobdella robusta TaxID=6412 RepID=T1FP87_HELRO|nr:hypothetical protein HELRODRAFT_187315 [Helobdella robusta]ESN97886.1 hypothetical protein HELRODRAFT_187315 [Helobdella robusta]
MEGSNVVMEGSVAPQVLVTDEDTNGDKQNLQHFIIWRDRRTDSNVELPQLEHVEMENLDGNADLVFVKFMKAHNCYDLIPTSAKLLIFDTELGVKKALLALVWNSLRAAPLWDGKLKKFVGMLTITDFIKILHKYYKNSKDHIHELERHKISTWKEELDNQNKPLITIHPEASLYEAIHFLYQHKIHRLPVVDYQSGNILYILTHKRILRFLYLYVYDLPQPNFMEKSIGELGVGTYKDIITVTHETTLITAITLFVDHRISALPVVDSSGSIIDLYAKFDVFNLAIDKSYDDLNQTIGHSLKERRERIEAVSTCLVTESLSVVMERIVRAEVHRLVVVNASNQVVGVISLSDILHFISSEESILSQRRSST